ncbi:MAG TPA: cupin domain-containing protein, partial [Reyranella sp.]|nr:cupin domain-containing protein [Reyranella sp.]
MGVTADEIIAHLGMKPHPEGGHYVETFRAPGEGRSSSTAIYFLLKAGERSHWHRVDAAEIWQYSAGDPLELRIWAGEGAAVETHHLGDG